MADIYKTVEDLENILREIVCIILNLDPDVNHKRIRFPWGSNLQAGISSSPMSNKDEDTCYIYALPHDDLINRQHDRIVKETKDGKLIKVITNTNVHRINFVNYGRNAYEYAIKIREGFYSNPKAHKHLKQNHLSIVTDIPAVQRVPEINNNEWWNRVDVTITINELVRREYEINAFEEITVNIPGVLPPLTGGNGNNGNGGAGEETSNGIYIVTEKDKIEIDK